MKWISIMSGGTEATQWIYYSSVFDEQGSVTNLHLKQSLIRGPGSVWRASHSFNLCDHMENLSKQYEQG